MAEHVAVVDFLPRLAPHRIAGHLADEQNQRGRILAGGMHGNAGIGRAWATGDKADTRFAGELAVGLGHLGGSAFLSAHHQTDLLAHLVQGFDGRQEALPRHTEHGACALQAQGVNENLPPGAGGHSRLGHDAAFCKSGVGTR